MQQTMENKANVIVYVTSLLLLIALPHATHSQQIDAHDESAQIDLNDPLWRMQLLNRFQEMPSRDWPHPPPPLLQLPHNWPQQQNGPLSPPTDQNQQLNAHLSPPTDQIQQLNGPNENQQQNEPFQQPLINQNQQMNGPHQPPTDGDQQFNQQEMTGNFHNFGKSNEVPQPVEQRPQSPIKQAEGQSQRLHGVASSILVPLIPVHVDNMGNTVQLPLTFHRHHPPPTAINNLPAVPQQQFPNTHNDNRFEEQKNAENPQMQQQSASPFVADQIQVFEPQNQHQRFNRQQKMHDPPQVRIPVFRPFPPQQDNRRLPNNFEQTNNFRRPPQQRHNRMPPPQQQPQPQPRPPPQQQPQPQPRPPPSEATKQQFQQPPQFPPPIDNNRNFDRNPNVNEDNRNFMKIPNANDNELNGKQNNNENNNNFNQNPNNNRNFDGRNPNFGERTPKDNFEQSQNNEHRNFGRNPNNEHRNFERNPNNENRNFERNPNNEIRNFERNSNNRNINFNRNPNLLQSESSPPNFNQFPKNQMQLPEVPNALPPLPPNQRPPFGLHQPPPRFPFPPQGHLPGPPMHPQGPNMHPQGPNMHPQGSNMHPQGPNMHPQGPNMHPLGPQMMHPPGPQMMHPPNPQQQMPPTRDVQVPKIFGDFPSEPKFDRGPWIPITPLPKVIRKPVASPSREAIRVERPPQPLSSTPSPQSMVVSVGTDFDVLPTSTVLSPRQVEEAISSTLLTMSSTPVPITQSTFVMDQRNMNEIPPDDRSENLANLKFARERFHHVNRTDFQPTDNSTGAVMDDQLNRARRLKPPQTYYQSHELDSSTMLSTPLDEQLPSGELNSSPWTDATQNMTSQPSVVEQFDSSTSQSTQEMPREIHEISVDQLYRHWKTQFGHNRDSNNLEALPTAAAAVTEGSNLSQMSSNEQMASLNVQPADWSSRTTSSAPDPVDVTVYPVPQIQPPAIESNTAVNFANTLATRNRRKPDDVIATTEFSSTETPPPESFITPSAFLHEQQQSSPQTEESSTRKPVLVRRRKVIRKKVSKSTSTASNQVKEYSQS